MKEDRDYQVPLRFILSALVLLVYAINIAVLVCIIKGVHRLFAVSPTDFESSVTIVGTILGMAPLWVVSTQLIPKKVLNSTPGKLFSRKFIVLGHVIVWSFAVILWVAWLPLQGHRNFNKGIEAQAQKNHLTAIRYFERARYQLGERADIHYHLANIHQDLSNVREAEVHYWLSIYQDDAYPAEAFNNLALLLLERDDKTLNALDLLDLAERRIALNMAQEEWLQRGIINKNRAWAYWKLGIPKTAKKYANEAVNNLVTADRLDDFPEVYCLLTLVNSTDNYNSTEDSELQKAAPENCRHNQSRIQSKNGAIREIYIEVLRLENRSAQ